MLRTLSRFRKKKENLSSYVHFLYKTLYSLIRRFHFKLLHSLAVNARGGGVTPLHYVYGYVPPNGVEILKLLVWNGV